MQSLHTLICLIRKSILVTTQTMMTEWGSFSLTLRIKVMPTSKSLTMFTILTDKWLLKIVLFARSLLSMKRRDRTLAKESETFEWLLQSFSSQMNPCSRLSASNLLLDLLRCFNRLPKQQIVTLNHHTNITLLAMFSIQRWISISKQFNQRTIMVRAATPK